MGPNEAVLYRLDSIEEKLDLHVSHLEEKIEEHTLRLETKLIGCQNLSSMRTFNLEEKVKVLEPHVWTLVRLKYYVVAFSTIIAIVVPVVVSKISF